MLAFPLATERLETMTTYATKPNRNASYREIGGPDGHLAARRPFTGNSMSAHLSADGDRYTVCSYETVIAEWVSGEGARMVERRTIGGEMTVPYYSPTTTRHQNLCRAWLLRD